MAKSSYLSVDEQDSSETPAASHYRDDEQKRLVSSKQCIARSNELFKWLCHAGKFLIGAKFRAENGGFMLLSWTSTGTIPTSDAGVRFAEERDENAG